MSPSLRSRSVFWLALAARGERAAYARERRVFGELEYDRDKLQSVRDDRLPALLAAARNVPHYRESLRHIKSWDLDALSGLPVLTKSDLQDRFNLLRNPKVQRASRKTTGGSTGQAITVLKNPEAIARERAATAAAYGWFGVHPGDRSVRLWGSSTSLERRTRAQLADWAMNRRTLSAFAFNSEDLDRYLLVCQRDQPLYLYGYSSMLEEFARHLDGVATSNAFSRLRSVISTSEPLSTPRRQVIERVFGVPVQNEYGCGEVGPIAYECEEGSLHVMSHNLIVEILDDEGQPRGPGEVGQVVVTDLNNHAMPLLRYAVADRAEWGTECDCGRSFPVLRSVVGRQYDYLEDAHGRRYHGEAVMYVFEDLRDAGYRIKAFQVLQSAPGTARLLLVAPGAPQDLDGAVEDMFRSRLGGLAVQVERRDSIPRAPSGKHRIIRRS